MEACTPANVCTVVTGLNTDIQALWDEVFGVEERDYIVIGNMGVPTNDDLVNDTIRHDHDLEEYTMGAAVVNSFNPVGLIIVGGMNYDLIDRNTVDYPLWNQETKIYKGFSDLLLKQRIFPAMGAMDYWSAQDWVGTLPEQMEKTVLRMFPYLTAAKRYHSVYDDKTNSEIFFLSSGRYTDPTNGANTGFLYADDISMIGDQYTWFAQRIAATPAKNKIVVFYHPFTSIVDTIAGTTGVGAANVFSDFEQWDFEEKGVKLIINGHSGSAFHLRQGSMHIVNSSAFVRSRMGLIEMADDSEPPQLTDIYGVQGYSVEYYSRRLMADSPIDNVEYPVAPGDFVVPRNELFRMTLTKGGIRGQFISYNTDETTYEGLLNSKTVNHEFEISAND
jgi:hypothetical protein